MGNSTVGSLRWSSIVWLAICALCGLPTADAYFTFGELLNVESTVPVIDPITDVIDCFSSDGLEMYITSRPERGGCGDYDMWVLRRSSENETWGPPENLGPAVNTPNEDSLSSLSADGLELYFCSNRTGAYDIYVTRRPSKDAPWEQPVSLGPRINDPTCADATPCISPDGLELYFESSYRPGGYGSSDIYVAKRATLDDPWEEAVNLGPVVNSASRERYHSLSPDGLLLFFDVDAPDRPGGYGGRDMWVARRATRVDPWQAPANLGPVVNSPFKDSSARVSADGRTLYFTRNTGGIWSNWQVPILPVVDFNGDGKVDGKDVVVLAQHWGESDSVCDIGPYAWGDGIVDEQDLFTLAEYLEKEVVDPTLVAHWALDETEGMMAADSAGGNDAMVMGDPAWQPDGGSVGGALAFDGIDDCIVANPVPELSQGPFSILAWVKGGAAHEVIVSCGTADWLYTNPADGSLMTALSSIAGNGVPLFSDVVITDGQWHRIGLVWDGRSRILYVDGQEVARDEQGELAVPDAGMIIGAGATPNRFFSGQIDDIRIYNRAVKP